MNKELLKAGDLALNAKLGTIGLVMRHDSEHGLLMAFPGMNELSQVRPEELEWQGSLKARTDFFTERELRLLLAALRGSDLRALETEFEAAIDQRVKEKLK